MSTTKHTPGPLIALNNVEEGPFYIYGKHDNRKLYTHKTGLALGPGPVLVAKIELGECTPQVHEEQKANVQRIVDCVNACEGINPAAVPELVKALENLVEAFRVCIGNEAFAEFNFNNREVKAAFAALKLAKGE